MRIIALIGVALAAPAAAEPAAEVATGLTYEEGDYGTGERIARTTLDNRVRVRSGDVLLSASLPFHRIDAPGNVVGGGGPLGLPILIDPTRPPARDVRSGVGDLRVGAAWLPQVGGVGLALTGEVKLPTASARRGIGTGETDATVGIEATRTIGAVTPFAGISYTLPGDPEGYALDDSLAARGGVSVRLGRGVSGSLSYGFAQSLHPLVGDEQQVATGLDIGLSRRVSLGLTGAAGLSEGSPDASAQVRLAWRLF
jgi:hypothetical protein